MFYWKIGFPWRVCLMQRNDLRAFGVYDYRAYPFITTWRCRHTVRHTYVTARTAWCLNM